MGKILEEHGKAMYSYYYFFLCLSLHVSTFYTSSPLQKWLKYFYCNI